MDDADYKTQTSCTWCFPITWSQHFNDMESASAANQPSILHKYHWSTLCESPSNLHPIVKIKLYIHYTSFNKINGGQRMSFMPIITSVLAFFQKQLRVHVEWTCLHWIPVVHYLSALSINKVLIVRWDANSKQ
jgi:hypothetical protein